MLCLIEGISCNIPELNKKNIAVDFSSCLCNDFVSCVVK